MPPLLDFQRGQRPLRTRMTIWATISAIHPSSHRTNRSKSLSLTDFCSHISHSSHTFRRNSVHRTQLSSAKRWSHLRSRISLPSQYYSRTLHLSLLARFTHWMAQMRSCQLTMVGAMRAKLCPKTNHYLTARLHLHLETWRWRYVWTASKRQAPKIRVKTQPV